MNRNAYVSASGDLAEETVGGRTNWAELMQHMNVNLHVCTYAKVQTVSKPMSV